MRKNKFWTLIILSIFALATITMGACQTAQQTEKPKAETTETTGEKPKVGETKAEDKKDEVKDGEVVGKGNFEGKSDHITKGTASLEKTEKGYQVVLGEDFDFDGAPAPIVALGNEGYKKETKLSELKSNKGKQVYEVPASIDATKHDEVWLWCTKFDVPLGVAKLSK